MLVGFRKILRFILDFLLEMTEQAYKEWVLADYELKLAARELPTELVSPTPAGLKAEAVKICERRFLPKDELMLRSFFNQKDSPAAYRSAIQNADASVFKPLRNFLEDRSINTQFRNIQLLAWLTDFEPRPFQPSLVYQPSRKDPVTASDEIVENGTEISVVLENEDEEKRLSEGKLTRKTSYRFIYLLLFLMLALGGYFGVNKLIHRSPGPEGCMIWDNDHYQPVDCHDQNLTVSARRIDHQLVDHFRKILKPDTLTLHSIGKVWYAKYNGRVEFFTAEGYHPLDSNRRLLPMTDHILEKYVYHISN